MDVKKVRRDAQARNSRKKEIMQYIIDSMKESAGNTTYSICEDDENAEEAPWSQYLHQTRPSYYY